MSPLVWNNSRVARSRSQLSRPGRNQSPIRQASQYCGTRVRGLLTTVAAKMPAMGLLRQARVAARMSTLCRGMVGVMPMAAPMAAPRLRE